MVEDDIELRARERLGTTLRDKYRLERLLGVGGMAAVYLALHRNGRRMALKMLHPELSLNREIRERFLREGQAANRVAHPGAVAVLDDDVSEDGAAFLVMELLAGDNLDELWLRHGQRLSAHAASAIGLELLSVLEVAHANGIVHRDIKPANLFVTNDGQLKVLDFGIARVLEPGQSSSTQTGLTLGTPAFMAPEQALGKTTLIDARTDLWSVGATLFTLLSGHSVHEAESAQEALIRAATSPARALRSVSPSVPGPLAAIVDRALAFDRDARFRSAAEMRQALADVHRAAFGAEPTMRVLAELLTRGQLQAAGSAPTAISEASAAHVVSAPADAMSSRKPPARVVTFALVAALAIALALALVATMRALHAHRAETADAPAADVSSAISPVPSAHATPTEAAPSAVSSSAASSAGSAPAGSASEMERPAKASQRPRTRAAPPTPAALPTPPKNPCTPPYRLDASGNKIWKRECL